MHLVATTICVLNWQNWQSTIDCLRTIFAQSLLPQRVLVVDNGSTNESATEIVAWLKTNIGASGFKLVLCDDKSEGYPELAPFETIGQPLIGFIKNSCNRGFAGGFNVALRLIHKLPTCDFVVLLNSDTLLPADFLKVLQDRASRFDHRIGLVGPLVLSIRDHTDWQRPERYRPSVWMLPFRGYLIARARSNPNSLPWLFSRFWYTGMNPSEVFMIHGSCLILTRSFLDKELLLDEGTFLYWEEAILSETLGANGLKVWFEPSIKIYHGWGNSSVAITKHEYLRASTIYYFETIRKVHLFARIYLRCYLFIYSYLVRMRPARRA
jgi:GT2 family glycosyltransferase